MIKNYLKKIFTKSIKNNEDTYVDILISLKNNYEMDIKLYLDDNAETKSINKVEYALVLSEFLNIILCGKIKNQIVDILINQIKNNANQDLINSILGFLLIMEKEEGINTPLIKPSEVFARYKNG